MPHVPANHNPQAGKQNKNTSITTVFQIGWRSRGRGKPNLTETWTKQPQRQRECRERGGRTTLRQQQWNKNDQVLQLGLNHLLGSRKKKLQFIHKQLILLDGGVDLLVKTSDKIKRERNSKLYWRWYNKLNKRSLLHDAGIYTSHKPSLASVPNMGQFHWSIINTDMVVKFIK